MYPSLRSTPPDAQSSTSAALAGSGRWVTVSRNVVLLGLTSLFTDISSEMLTAVLPLYFMLELRMTPLQFGLIDGLYQGTSALVRLASGMVADAGARYKTVATFGYGLSAACKPALLAVGSNWSALAGLMMLDRLGKGIRTAPRDALITLSSDPARLGEAFGVHRALDTVGAVLGPILAFWILSAAPGAFDAVFVASFAVAVIGLAIIWLFVENRSERQGGARSTEADTTVDAARADGVDAGAGADRVATRSADADRASAVARSDRVVDGSVDLIGGDSGASDRAGAATDAAPRRRESWLRLFVNRPFRALLIAGVGLSLMTASDALIYLLLQRRGDVPTTLFPLFFVGTAAVYLVLALPFGRLADRIGRHRLFIAGHVLVLGIYAILHATALSTTAVVACLGLLGAYYAATDGVLSSLASAVLPASQLTTGLAVVSTATALARLLAASLFGAVWTLWDADGALVAFLAGLGIAILGAVLLLQGSRPWTEKEAV